METALDYTRRLLRQGAQAKKSLGQNFLVDDRVIEKIADLSTAEFNRPLVEIGPGLGALTRILVRRVARLWAVELDASKISLLQRELQGLPLELLHRDALSLDLREIWGEGRGYLVGNLPYYITSPLIHHFLDQAECLEGMTLMVQKEVADRLVASPGGRDYGVLTVAVRLAAEVSKVMTVPASSFWPQPKVDSAVVNMVMRPYPGFGVDRQAFFRVVRAAFSQRRKTLANSLAAGLTLSKEQAVALLQRAGIEAGRRAETLAIEELQVLTAAYLDVCPWQEKSEVGGQKSEVGGKK